MSSTSLIKGAVFAERYQVVRRIAVGGMGAVYEVTHFDTGRRCALKVMHAHCLQDAELRERFRMEARVAVAIETEHVVDVFDAGIDAATQMPFMVMELLRGDDLGKLLRKRTRFTPIETMIYLRQVATALDKMHQASVVHRDLKPENLFLTYREDGAPWIKVLDFGIAKVLAEDASRMNATSSIGTPLYMAPEQFRQDLPISCSTDLYALGMVAYTLLVGWPYWREESRRSEGNLYVFAREIMEGPVEAATARARRAGVDLPDAFDPWFAKATALSPARRFLTAGDLVMALAIALGVSPAGSDSMETAKTRSYPLHADGAESTIRTAPGVGTTNPPSTPPARKFFRRAGAGVGMAALVATVLVLLGRVLPDRAQGSPQEDASVAQAAAPATAIVQSPGPTAPVTTSVDTPPPLASLGRAPPGSISTSTPAASADGPVKRTARMPVAHPPPKVTPSPEPSSPPPPRPEPAEDPVREPPQRY